MAQDFLEYLKQQNIKPGLLGYMNQQSGEGGKSASLTGYMDRVEKEKKDKLAAAQLKVKWIHEMNEPKRKEFVFNMQESFKEKTGYHPEDIFTHDFWQKTADKTLVEALGMAYEMSFGFQKRWGERGEEAMWKHSKYLDPGSKFVVRKSIPKKRREELKKAFESGQKEDPLWAGTKEVARMPWDMVAYIPKTLVNFAKNPYETIQEDFLDLMTVIAAVGGAKIAKGVFAKVRKATVAKQPVSLKTFVDPLVEAGKKGLLSEELTHRMLKIPLTEIEMPTGAWEIVKQPKGGVGATFRHQVVNLSKDIAKAGDIKPGAIRWLKGKIQIPLRMMEKYPTARNLFYDEARNGGYVALQRKVLLAKKFKLWEKMGVKGKQSWKRVGTALAHLSEDGRKLMANLDIEMPQLSPIEWKAVSWIRSVYDKYLVQINQARTLNGLKAIKPQKNYFTFIRSLNKMQEAGIDLYKDPTSTINNALATAFRFAKTRKPQLFGVPIELQADLVLKAYSNAALDHIHLASAIGKARAFLTPFTHAGKKASWFNLQKTAPNFHAALAEWTDAISGVHNAIPKGGHAKFYKALKGIQKNVAVGVLGWNARSALIQPTALRLSYVMLGEHNLVNGLWKNFTSPKWRKFALKESKVLLGRTQGYAMDVHMAMVREGGIGKKFSKARQRFAESSMKPLQLLDFETARATWIGAYKLAEKMLNKGKTIGKNHRLFKQAIRYADDVIVKTQASAAIWDVAPIQRTMWGKMLTMFQTFVINEFDFLTSDLFTYKNPYVKMSGVGGNLARLTLASGVINYLYEGVLKIRSPYPAPEVAYMRGLKGKKSGVEMGFNMFKEMLETLPVVGGGFRWSTAYKTAFPAYIQTAFVDPIQMINRLSTKPSITADQAEWIGKLAGMAGTSQGFKIWRRLKRGQTWYEAVLGVREEVKVKKKVRKKNRWNTQGW